MIRYKGKAKCSCGRRAKWKLDRGVDSLFRCNLHKHTIENMADEPGDDFPDSVGFTQAKRSFGVR